jgi:beta-galactosidase GanA
LRARAAARVALLAGAIALVSVFASSVPAPAKPRRARAADAHTITLDKYSLMIDGRRTFIWSGEFHPFRLPSLWRDVLEKLKAEGYDGVSIYFDWGYHSPKSGVYDFHGVRDVDKVLVIARQVGLDVIARPGPYINGELDAGGFPGWLLTQAGRARTNATDYLAAVDQWLTEIDAVIARHQLTNGTGPGILYQIENELGSAGTAQQA